MAKKEQTLDEKKKNERAVFGALVREQRGPVLYKVLSLGTCVEFTDELKIAKEAYNEAANPRQLFAINRATGKVDKLYEQIL